MPYSIEEAKAKHLLDEKGRKLFLSDLRTVPGIAKPVDLGLYELRDETLYSKAVKKYDLANQQAAFGVPSHTLTGSGNVVEIVSCPQKMLSPMNPKVIGWQIGEKDRTHEQHMSEYMQDLCNAMRKAAPTGCDIWTSEEPRVVSKDSKDEYQCASLVATNPQALPGPFLKDAPVNVQARSAIFRYKVKDTREAVKWRNIWSIKVAKADDRSLKETAALVTHMMRGDSNMFGVVNPMTGRVLLDLNIGAPHLFSEQVMKPSVVYNYALVSFIAKVIGYWMDRGTVFTQQRVLTSNFPSGGLPLHSADETEDQWTRRHFEVGGVSKLIREGKVHVSPIMRMTLGDMSDDHQRALRTDKTIPRAKTAQGEIEYILQETYVPILDRHIPLWQVSQPYGYKNANVAAVVERMSDYINYPMFYGPEARDLNGQVVMGKDSNGKPVPFKKYAVGYVSFMGAEDYERAGVWLKREFSLSELNSDTVMLVLGYEQDRKEGGHDWLGEGEYLPIDTKGFDPNATGMTITDRVETTFEWRNRKIYKFNPATWAYWQERLYGQKVSTQSVPTSPNGSNRGNVNVPPAAPVVSTPQIVTSNCKVNLNDPDTLQRFINHQKSLHAFAWTPQKCAAVLGRAPTDINDLNNLTNTAESRCSTPEGLAEIRKARGHMVVYLVT